MKKKEEKVVEDYDDVTIDDIHREVDDLPGYNPPLDEEPTSLEPIGTVYTKYRTEAEIPNRQKDFFDDYRGGYGRHVALSNTKRSDNPRHLLSMDIQSMWERMPTHAHRANLIRIRETSEFQMCRSNPEVGGFEAKIGQMNIRRDDVDVRQSQSILRNLGERKRKGILNFLKR